MKPCTSTNFFCLAFLVLLICLSTFLLFETVTLVQLAIRFPTC